MPRAKTNGIEIEYETFGDAEAPPLLLIMGLSMQMIGWDEAFCAELAARGFHVVRFDNRDVGLSTRIDAPLPNVPAIFMGDHASVAYTIDDMAADVAGLLDALGMPSAHVVGASMGGMIAQMLAIRYPEKVRSLCSIMSATGNRRVGQPKPEAIMMLMTPPPADRAAFLDHAVVLWRTIGSPGFPFDEAKVRARMNRSFERGHDPAGAARQFGAIAAARDRTAELAKVRCPVLVIHGAADPLIAPDGGEATARAIPGAELMLIPGMGHDVPEALWGRIQEAIVANAARAG
jgi:pimeloyl-ACP methyl ester carboxylesterase